MEAGTVARIEQGVDVGASAIFAAAAGFASYALLRAHFAGSALFVSCGIVAALALLLCRRALNTIGPRVRPAAVSIFHVRDIEAHDVDEPAEEPLLLDDIIAELGPNSRVVRLFDAAAMPSPGELRTRIDRHLDPGSPAAQPGASEALHEAIAELRRSLR